MKKETTFPLGEGYTFHVERYHGDNREDIVEYLEKEKVEDKEHHLCFLLGWIDTYRSFVTDSQGDVQFAIANIARARHGKEWIDYRYYVEIFNPTVRELNITKETYEAIKVAENESLVQRAERKTPHALDIPNFDYRTHIYLDNKEVGDYGFQIMQTDEVDALMSWNEDKVELTEEEYNIVVKEITRRTLVKKFSRLAEQYAELEEDKRRGKILPREERMKKMEEYKESMLEGGEGYNPYVHYTTQEYYDEFMEIYNAIKQKLEQLKSE